MTTFCPHGRDDEACPPIYCGMQPIDPLTGQASPSVEPFPPTLYIDSIGTQGYADELDLDRETWQRPGRDSYPGRVKYVDRIAAPPTRRELREILRR